MWPLTGWDWLVLVTALVSTALGFWRGGIRTLFGLGAWLAGVVAAPFVVAAASAFVPPATVPVWVQFIGAFIIVFIAVRLAGAVLLRGVRSIGLGGLDRFAGGTLGLARAGLVVLIAAVVAFRLGFAAEPAWRDAMSRPLLDWMVATADPLLPPTTSLPQRLRRDETDFGSTADAASGGPRHRLPLNLPLRLLASGSTIDPRLRYSPIGRPRAGPSGSAAFSWSLTGYVRHPRHRQSFTGQSVAI